MWEVKRVEPRWKVWTRGWEYSWYNSAYGAFCGKAWTKTKAHRYLDRGQREMWRG